VGGILIALTKDRAISRVRFKKNDSILSLADIADYPIELASEETSR
jgi:hypothetical protein